MSLDNFRKRAIVWDTVNKDFPQPIQIMQGDVNARTLSVKIIDNGGEIDLTGHSLKLTYQYTNSSNSGFVMIPPENLTKGEFILVIPTEMTETGVIEANLILLNEDKEQVIVSKNLTFISDNSTVTDLAQEVNNKIDDFTKLLLENMPQVMRSELNDLHDQTDSNTSNIELKTNQTDFDNLQTTVKGQGIEISMLENNVQSNTSRITNLEQIRSVNFAKNYVLGVINTTGSIGTNINTTVKSVPNFRCVTLSCTVGQKFRVHGTGGMSPKLWAFLDSSNNLVASQDGAYAYVQQDIIITVPVGATKLIVNFNVPTLQSAAQALLCEYDVTTVDNNEHAIEIIENQSYNQIQTIEEDTISSFINGIHFSDELHNHITDFAKPGDLMVHVSSFCIINDIVYMTYYANTISASENPAQHTARFVHCPLNDLSNKIFVDLCNIGDTINGKTVTAIYDTILLRKDDKTLYLMWTVALGGEYYRVYKTFDVETQTISDVSINTFTVGATTNKFSISGMSSSLDANNITYKPISGDIGIMQKLSKRVEGGTTYYYTGAYVGPFNCIIKSSDLINWIYVSQPDFVNDSQWENAVYVIGDKVFYFCRQYAHSQFGFLTFYNIATGQWSDPVMVYDAQSRSDFFMYNDVLYLVHAPKDRNHIAIMQIDQKRLNRSRDIKVAKVPDYFYPFTQIYNGELYMSFTQTRKHIWLSKFTLNAISTDAIIDKFKQLFLP